MIQPKGNLKRQVQSISSTVIEWSDNLMFSLIVVFIVYLHIFKEQYKCLI